VAFWGRGVHVWIHSPGDRYRGVAFWGFVIGNNSNNHPRQRSCLEVLGINIAHGPEVGYCEFHSTTSVLEPGSKSSLVTGFQVAIGDMTCVDGVFVDEGKVDC
jgi:hypothetical protein